MKNLGVIEGTVLFPVELKDGKNNSKWCRFRIRNEFIYNEKKMYNDYDITCFGTNAEIASMSCKIGCLVEVDYHLQKIKTESKDYTNLICDEIRFKESM